MKFKIGNPVKHRAAEDKMIIRSYKAENKTYTCTWYNPEISKREDGFITSDFHEIELEEFIQQQIIIHSVSRKDSDDRIYNY